MYLIASPVVEEVGTVALVAVGIALDVVFVKVDAAEAAESSVGRDLLRELKVLRLCNVHADVYDDQPPATASVAPDHCDSAQFWDSLDEAAGSCVGAGSGIQVVGVLEASW
jgi:hypothetical protein